MLPDIQAAEYIDPQLQDIINNIHSKDDRIPFLLLPVRVETRFMQVDRPLNQSWHGMDRVLPDLVEANDQLSLFGSQSGRPFSGTLKQLKALDNKFKRAISSLKKAGEIPAQAQVWLKQQTQTLQTQSQRLMQKLNQMRPSRAEDRTALKKQKDVLAARLSVLKDIAKEQLRPERAKAEGAGIILQSIQEIVTKLEAVRAEKLDGRSKPERRQLYDTLDGTIKHIEQALKSLESKWKASWSASTVEINQLKSAYQKIIKTVEALPGKLTPMYSQFKRNEYQEKFKVLKQRCVDPLQERILNQYIPDIQLQQTLKKRSTNEVYYQTLQLDLVMRRLSKQAVSTLAQYRSLGQQLLLEVRKIGKTLDRVIIGHKAEYHLLRKTWDSTRQVLGTMLKSVKVFHKQSTGAIPAKDQKQWQEIQRWYIRLKTLAAQELPRGACISRQAVIRSARVFTEVKEQLDKLNTQLKTVQENSSASHKSRIGVLEKYLAISPRLQAYGRQLTVLPKQQLGQLKKTHQQIQTMARESIQTLAARKITNPAKKKVWQKFVQTAEQTQINLEKIFYATITDSPVYTGDIRPEDGPGVVFEEATQTVDELWVRIYPDDVFVHSHEPELTADEVEAGKTFWQETWLAQGDSDHQLAAWRTLTASFGSQRSAWIAKLLKPKQLTLPPERENPFRVQDTVLEALTQANQGVAEYLQADPADVEAGVNTLGKVSDAFKAMEDVFAVGERWPISIYQKMAGQQKRLHGKMIGLNKHLQRAAIPDSDLRERAAQTLGKIGAQYHKLQKQFAAAQPISNQAWFNEYAREVLLFPEVAVKAETWAHAPHTKVLPDRFAVLALQDGNFQHIQVGRLIPNPLNVGLNPEKFNLDLFAYDAEGNLSLDEDIQWMTDFDQAVQKGMGLILTLNTAQANQGFDKLLVLGVKDSSAADGQARLEELLQNHHYADEGMAFLPIGTPTNNTAEGKAGYSSSDRTDEESFAVERRGDLFSVQESDPWRQSDGLRMAEALGITADVFQNIENSQRTEISQALVMNHALWHGTLGYYMEDILDTFFDLDTIRRMRSFTTQYVCGRGRLPSLRIGSQPYGILPVTAFSKIAITPGNVLPEITAADENNPTLHEEKKAQRFAIQYFKLLGLMQNEWMQQAKTQVKCSDNTDPQDPQLHFMTMLGLHASSVETYQRYNLNVADRRTNPTSQESSVNFNEGDYFGPFAFWAKFKDVLNTSPEAERDWHNKIRQARLYRSRYLQTHSWLKGPRVDDKTLSEKASLQPVEYDGKNQTYIDWLLGSHLYALWNDNNLETLPSRSLLFLLLRQSLLLEYRDAALNVFQKEKLIDENIRSLIGDPGYYFTYSPFKKGPTFITKWSWLFHGIQKLDGLYRNVFPDNAPLKLHLGEHSLAEFLYDSEHNSLFNSYAHMGQHQPAIESINKMRRAVSVLNGVPTAQLDRLFSEQLDICSYRLDAWILSLANERLGQCRAQQPQGIYLGAFGWLENLRPGGEREVAPRVPDSLQRPGEPLVYTDADNQGFIHAPSLSHAVTAAILRSGYKSNQATDDVENQLAVNLSSRRVRAALYLLEGVRQGHEIAALLGYQFERGLHERYTSAGLELDAYIFPLRRRFPSVGTVDENLARTDAQTQVVDGQALLQAVRQSIEDLDSGQDTLLNILESHPERYPFGVEESGTSLLPPNGTLELRAIFKEINRIADAFDALGDLLLSESVYQVARGNHTRAAAVVTALSEGRYPPDVQIMKTPRGGIAVTQRVGLCLAPVDGQTLSIASGLPESTVAGNIENAKPAGWEEVTYSVRALAEPSLNKWLGEMIGDPDKVRCVVEYSGEEGTESIPVTLKALDIQPLDLVQMMGAGLAEGGSELNNRIAYWVRQHRQLTVAQELKIFVQERSQRLLLPESNELLTTGIKTFYEIAPLVTNLWEVTQGSRPLAADDVMIPEEEPDAPADPTRQNLSEYAFRLRQAKAAMEKTGIDILKFFRQTEAVPESLAEIDIKAEIYSDETIDQESEYIQTRIDTLRTLLFQASAFGIPQAVPESAFESTPEIGKALTQQVGRVLPILVKRLKEYAQAMLHQTASACDEAFRKIFGRAFRTLPLFELRNSQELQTVYAARDDLLRHVRRQVSAFSLDLWFQSAAKTRKRLGPLESVALLADTFGQTAPSLTALQLPYQADDYWLGLEFPGDWEIDSDKLSLVLGNADLLSQNSTHYAGLIFDEWVEIIPHKQEVTGITFNYDQPGSMPPQSALLAVAPNQTGNWSWDNLVYTLLETLELAKLRAVEPDHLDQTLFSQIVPAVMSEVVPQQMQEGDENPMGVQIVLDFKVNNPPSEES